MRYLIKPIMIAGFAITAQAASADNVTCTGTAPDWSLTLDGETVTFTYQRQSELQIMQDDVDLNGNNVRALTVVGPRDSAIVILDQTADEAVILTQRGETPVILTGSCE